MGGQEEVPVATLDLARKAVRKNPNNQREASRDLLRAARKDAAILDHLAYVGAVDIIRDVMRSLRLSEGGSNSLRKVADKLRSELGELRAWTLESGKSLADATRIDLVEAARSLESVAVGMMSRAILYRAIASSLPDDRATVSSLGPLNLTKALAGAEEKARALIRSYDGNR